ncbi:MAG: hypothetical protein ACFFEE_08360 [Candidatus Thorarchaeota archaeon]
MPKSKKRKPGTGMSKQFETIICISQVGLLFLLWILSTFYQLTSTGLILVYFIGTLIVIIVLRAINPSAAEKAMDALPRGRLR